MNVRRVCLGIAGICLTVPLMISDADAQAGTPYPTKPIRIVVPFAAGGPTDLLTRTIGQKLTEAWGQQVLVDNRGGANGILGTELVARSAPDGYTLVMGSNGTHGINASLYQKLPYDTLNDFVAVARPAVAYTVLVAHPSLPVSNLKELIHLGRTRPGQLAWASGGSPAQLTAELFKRMTKIDAEVIPYKGNALAITAVLTGEVSVTFGNIAQSLPLIRVGKLKPIAVGSPRRVESLPDIATVAESGYPGFEASAWYGLWAPAGTPRPIVDRLNQEIVRILRLPEVRERLSAETFELPSETADQVAAITRGEVSKWSKLVKEIGLKPM